MQANIFRNRFRDDIQNLIRKGLKMSLTEVFVRWVNKFDWGDKRSKVREWHKQSSKQLTTKTWANLIRSSLDLSTKCFSQSKGKRFSELSYLFELSVWCDPAVKKLWETVQSSKFIWRLMKNVQSKTDWNFFMMLRLHESAVIWVEWC